MRSRREPGRSSPTHCSSTPTTQSISGTVSTVRRFGAEPFCALPNRTITLPKHRTARLSSITPKIDQINRTTLCGGCRTRRPPSEPRRPRGHQRTFRGPGPDPPRPGVGGVEEGLDLVVVQRAPPRVALVLATMENRVSLVEYRLRNLPKPLQAHPLAQSYRVSRRYSTNSPIDTS